jgi:hypothetical protein
MTSALSGYHLPGPVTHTILGSVGGGLAVAAHAGGTAGATLTHLARTAFISGMDLGLRTGAAVAVVAGVVAFAAMPSRPRAQPDHPTAGPVPAGRVPAGRVPADAAQPEPATVAPTGTPDDGHDPRPQPATATPDDGHDPRPQPATATPDDGHSPRPQPATATPDDGHSPRPQQPKPSQRDLEWQSVPRPADA